MSPGFESIFHDVARDYSALWDFKFRGSTLEIITPHSTISNKFISVFLTQRDNEYIVTDGGYLYTSDYVENESVEQSKCYTQTLVHFEKYYKIRRIYDSREKLIFFLKSANRAMISSLIHDMASFVTGVANAQQITLELDLEASTRTRFAKEASLFLLDVFPGRKVRFAQPLRPNDRIRFSAGIWRGTDVSLVQYVTGSDTYHFGNSMAKATVNFLAVNGSSLAPSVTKRISLIDTSAAGYRDGGHRSYVKLLNDTSVILDWQNRAALVELVENSGTSSDSDNNVSPLMQ